ncbi:META domain-containing protein [Corallincola spongiicola]|uniref:META domain-containing protein n=1 Tax=Corallincola spongiicola TaxID=2520508 RepID=A0ABY1WSC5_9GAMM|nr:META domain-containing protein [Corallincola spongiicola]TAA47434.1 META domain-containing protein [Corallincola spongiicola]
MQRHGKKRAWCVLAFITLWPLIGCAPPDQLTPRYSLVGEWIVTSMEGTDLVTNTPITFRFAPDETIAGTGGCNQFSGAYFVENDALRFGQFMVTAMSCKKAQNAQEKHFFANMGLVNQFELAGDTLLLISGDSDIVITAKAMN